MPITIIVLLSLLVILTLNKFIRNLFWSVAAATLCLALLCGHSWNDSIHIVVGRVSSANNLFLMLIVCQIIWLSRQMREAGVMSELVSVLRGMVSSGRAMALLPALIGVLPMPGGALFSAPLVGDCDQNDRLPPDLKTRVNYWFRHVWEYWWPLYPGVLLALEITGLSAGRFMLVQLPLSLFSILIGWFFLLRGVDAQLDDAERIDKPLREGMEKLLKLTLPITAIVASYACLKLFFPTLAAFNKYLPLALGIALGSTALCFQKPISSAKWKSILFSANVLKMVLLVEVIRIYGAFIESKLPDGAPLASRMHHELAEWGIPVTALIAVIPFLSGVSTGLAIGFVGASFPIVITLIGSDPTPSYLYGSIVLAYGSGYVGMLLSPVHVCLVVTNEHFKTSLFGSLKKLCAPAAALLLFVILYSLLVKFL